jgi:peroxiredoxin Q/BCP
MARRPLILAGLLALAPALGAAQDATPAPPATPAPAPTPDLKEGDMAPAFSLPGADGKTHTNADYKGRHVVLAWFPKAFTGG